MVARGSLGKYKPGKPSLTQYGMVVFVLIAFSLGMGYVAGIQPTGEWRFFSWHPLLMTSGMVGLSGIGAVTKKMGGYANTKLHGILGWLSIFVSLAGCYCIYCNKELNGYAHLKSTHAWCGLGVMINCVGLGMAGGIFLHPDFGVDKGNKTIRALHKWASRITLIAAWFTCILGLNQLIPDDGITLAMYSFPLLALVPFTLM